VFTGTGTAPILIAPRRVATKSTVSSITIITRSSRRTPRLRRALPTRLTRSPSAA
jgi:hypothetical protein